MHLLHADHEMRGQVGEFASSLCDQLAVPVAEVVNVGAVGEQQSISRQQAMHGIVEVEITLRIALWQLPADLEMTP